MVDRDLVLRKISEQMMIETCLDIANHIVADRGYRVPVSYADIFKVLGENNVLEKKLVDRMEKMAKFRNILVHQYEKIEAEIIVGLLKRKLGDFDQFKKAVVGSLQKPQNLE
jgi:uncharacterized protein YutE (UPF0331/DUF86 family)